MPLSLITGIVWVTLGEPTAARNTPATAGAGTRSSAPIVPVPLSGSTTTTGGATTTTGGTGTDTVAGGASGGEVQDLLVGYAQGGDVYETAGRYLRGPGDGMSDSIHAFIDGGATGNHQPARLGRNEFVIPADVVSDLGNGSSDAGADQLYDMMERVRKARHGTDKQPPAIKPGKVMPA